MRGGSAPRRSVRRERRAAGRALSEDEIAEADRKGEVEHDKQPAERIGAPPATNMKFVRVSTKLYTRLPANSPPQGG